MSFIVIRKPKDGPTEILVDTATIIEPVRFASYDMRRPWEFPKQFESLKEAGIYYRRYKKAEPDYEYEIREYLK